MRQLLKISELRLATETKAEFTQGRALLENKLYIFRRIFAGGQGSGAAAYSVIREATQTKPSGKKTRKMDSLFSSSA